MKFKTWKNKVKRNIHKAPLAAYVALSLSMVVIFTIVMIVIFCVYQSVPDTLVTCWYSCWAGECLFCTILKCLKIRKDSSDD